MPVDADDERVAAGEVGRWAGLRRCLPAAGIPVAEQVLAGRGEQAEGNLPAGVQLDRAEGDVGVDDQFRRDRQGVVDRDHLRVTGRDAGDRHGARGVLHCLDDVDLGDVLRARFVATSRADGQAGGVADTDTPAGRLIDRMPPRLPPPLMLIPVLAPFVLALAP